MTTAGKRLVNRRRDAVRAQIKPASKGSRWRDGTMEVGTEAAKSIDVQAVAHESKRSGATVARYEKRSSMKFK